MNEKTTTFVGLDAHKDQIVAAVLPSHDGEPVITKFGADGPAVRRFIQRLQRDGRSVAAC